MLTLLRCPFLSAALLPLALLLPAAAEEPEAEAPPGDAPPPAETTFTVKKAPLRIEVSLDGVFESRALHEISLRPQEWKDLAVLEAVSHGARVRKGDVLIALDLRSIDEAIRDLEAGLELSALELKESELELEWLESSLPLDLEDARHAAAKADEDLLRFLKVELEMLRKRADWRLKSSESSLEYNLEEL
ncbi:MAG: hypothetical protein JXA90_14915, partial [Planctomycetes bacterium]|nr:hypothetical protein [Planctomycetota bacterium]